MKCQICGSYLKKKKERSTIRYLCSRHDTVGDCKRNAIDEDYLVELIQRRFNRKVDRELIEKEVKIIMVENVKPYIMEIHLYNQESILFTSDFIRF
ncbi:hypothetical protein [Psychrobacillus phage Perkons]|nr:hypothetical protein [Psychrobacillus phage Perkons]